MVWGRVCTQHSRHALPVPLTAAFLLRGGFLLQTAVLDRLNGSLCDTITGQTDSGRMLENLERDNLFVVPLDDERHWYRYHHLFADMLRAYARRKDGEQIAEWHAYLPCTI